MSRDLSKFAAVQRQLAKGVYTALPAAAAVLLLAGATRAVGRTGAMVLLTAVGVLVGSALVDLQLRCGRVAPRRRALLLLVPALAAVAVSQVSYLLLVWTGWKTASPLWRTWYLSMVPSVLLTHLLLLRAAAAGRPGALERWTAACAAAGGLMFFVLGLRQDLLEQVPTFYFIIFAVPAAGTVLGSAAVAIGYVRRRGWRPKPMSRWGKVSWLIATHAVLLTVGLYVGRRSVAPGRADWAPPSGIAHLSPAELDRQVRTDLQRLRTAAAGMGELAGKMSALQKALAERLASEDRRYYLPEEDDRFRWQFVTYLSYRSALLRMMGAYSGFQAVRDPAARARCFMLGHAAMATTYQAGLKLVHAFRDKPLERRKLNEPEPTWGIPAGIFDRIYESVVGRPCRQHTEEMAAYFELKKPAWRKASVWSSEDFDYLESVIAAAQDYVRGHRIEGGRVQLELFLERVRQDASRPVYAVQSLVSEWIGATRIVEREPFITAEQIDAAVARLRPGDIILERRNWFLSNAFLPGFWPHVVLYVGGMEDLQRLGIADDPAVQQHREAYLARGPDGRRHAIIEALGEGVVFTTPAHSLRADYVAVLRPRLTDKQIARAIVQAFRHVGKPYDFEFDFFTSDKLVCSEVVYRAYEGLLHFELKRIIGRDTLPPLEIARKFAAERGKPGRELDFVLFLDAAGDRNAAVWADADALCESVDRPRSFNE